MVMQKKVNKMINLDDLEGNNVEETNMIRVLMRVFAKGLTSKVTYYWSHI
jgi:hypothetical protein